MTITRNVLAFHWGAIAGLGLALGCSSKSPDSGATGAATEQSTLIGIVTDTAGAVVTGATVTASGASTTTLADGTFALAVKAGTVLVAFSAPAHVSSQQSVLAVAGRTVALPVTLAVKSTPQPLDADQGGTVTGPRGASLTAPPGAFVDAATGQAIAGLVTIALTPLDPSIPPELDAYPGQLVATRLDGSATYLATAGVLDIDAEQNGRRLNVKSGATLTALMPAPADGSGPATIELWSFDESRALWQEEPGTLTLDPTTNTYAAPLPHLSSWNCDTGFAPACVKGRILDCDGNPVAGAHLYGKSWYKPALTKVTIPATSADTSDGSGRYSLGGVPGGTLSLVALDGQGGHAHAVIINGTTTAANPSNIAVDDPACIPMPDLVLGRGCRNEFQPGPDAGAPEPTDPCASGGEGTVVSPDGKNSWLTLCHGEVAAIFGCLSAGGGCTLNYSGYDILGDAKVEMDFGNGAKMVINATTGVASLYSPQGTFCGKMYTASLDGSMTIASAAGAEYLFDSSGTRVTCADGALEFLDASAQSSASTCTAGLMGGANCSLAP